MNSLNYINFIKIFVTIYMYKNKFIIRKNKNIKF